MLNRQARFIPEPLAPVDRAVLQVGLFAKGIRRSWAKIHRKTIQLPEQVSFDDQVGCKQVLALAQPARLVAVFATGIGIHAVPGLQWTAANLAVVWISVAVCGAALAVIWAKRAFDEVFYLWLVLVLVATMAELSLGSIAGGPYTVAWHAARASGIVSAYLLLVFLMREIAERLRRPVPAAIAAYGRAASWGTLERPGMFRRRPGGGGDSLGPSHGTSPDAEGPARSSASAPGDRSFAKGLPGNRFPRAWDPRTD